MKRVTFDFETRSTVDLKKAGAYKYSIHPTTQPTCMAFKAHGISPVKLLKFGQINTLWRDQGPVFKSMWEGFINQKYEFSCHNAFFERCIYNNVLVKRYGWPKIPFDSYRCTAAKAAACALPRNLAGAGEAMALSVQKDKRGLIAMMATCKPTRQWNAWLKKGKLGIEPPIFLEPEAGPEMWQVLYEYCVIDVLTEEKLDEALPDLIPEEQEIWNLNQRINWRGVKADIPVIKKILGMLETESKLKLSELNTLTMGLVRKPGSRKQIMEFLALEGIELPDIKAQTINDALSNKEIKGDMRRLLEIRKALSKTSAKKYEAFVHRATEDDRIRDLLLFHGASTGRDTGTGVQLHNLPKGLIPVSPNRPYAAVENVKECDQETLQLLYGDSLSVLFSSILRNMLIPSDNYELFVGDFSQVEVAVLWWLADNTPGLEVLNSGRDPYIYMAMANTGKKYDEIDGDERQLGKCQVLGAGFSMGAKKFRDTAFTQYRLTLTAKQSKEAVTKYREANAAVPVLWNNYEQAAISAIEKPGKETFAGKCNFVVKGGFLWVTLPSGRKLAYRKPTIIWRAVTYEETIVDKDGNEKDVKRVSAPKKTMQFWAVNPTNKKWETETTFGGRLTENFTQAVARDLMMHAMVRLEKKGYRALMSVHDEALCETVKGIGNVKEFTQIMCSRPAWADGNLPIRAKAWQGPRYRKQ